MLNRQVVEEFLDGEFGELELEMPEDIPKDKLVETFCLFTEDDYYEWLRDNFKSFFEHGNPDWRWIRGRIRHYEQQANRQGV
jgi:hypothetical protein